MRPTLILTMAAALLALAGCSSSSTPASSAAASPISSATSDAVPSTSLNPADGVRAWASGGGSAFLTDLGSDLTKVQSDYDKTDMTALVTSCAKLTSDIETAQAGSTIPDKAASTEWSLALTHLQKAAQDCTDGASSGDQASFDQMTAEMSIGINHFDSFNKRLTAITG